MLLFFIVDVSNGAPTTQINDEFRWGLLQRKAQEWKVCRAFGVFRDHGIEPILIKGLAATLYYPPYHHRYSIDMDLAVSADDFAAAEKIAKAVSAEGLAIDLHRELRHLDTVPWADLFENSLITHIEGCPLRVLRIEDHLRVLCVHWLTDGGADKERLWDIYYGIQNRPSDFDWERFLNSIPTHRRGWLICCVGLAARYLGLDLANTPIATEASRLPNWIIRTIDREWASDTKFQPLEVTLSSPTKFVKQIGKRLRPNPIRAAIHLDGSFDVKSPLSYQIRSAARKVGPTSLRVWSTIKQLSK